ncbi:excinuclease ABC subunit UvrC [Pelagibacteraceae bacterium]|nr:excinuclease ABC subunit UvrC [Pelagibacteraceae bacterium]
MTLQGQEIIRATSKTLPNQPGVYQMEDKKGNILYIGKAKNLSNRVKNYLSINNLTRRIQRMVSLTNSMNFFVTNTELEAIILECNLIKKHKPRFNVLLRDDKSFPYIFISSEHDFPRIEKYRGTKNKEGRYYGPFASPDAVNRTINTLQRIFLLRSCTDKEVAAGNKLCFNYYLKRCSGPCGGKITKKAYDKLIEAADDFLSSGSSEKIQKNFTDQMYKASKNKNFELAASLRDRLKALKYIAQNNSIKIKDIKNADVFAISTSEGKTCVYGSFFRNNTSYGGKAFYPDHDKLSEKEEIMLGFLNIFYAEKEIPEYIITNTDIKKNDSLNILGKNFENTKILKPVKGPKKNLLKFAEKNSRINLDLKLNKLKSFDNFTLEIRKIFHIKSAIDKIEAYDNSHTFGKYPVGVMVAYNSNGFIKSNYRKFNIKFNLEENKNKVDDYYMMKEMLIRRFKNTKFKDEIALPDLLLIDGGKGQYNAVKKVMHNLKIKVPIISMAKGVERDSGREILIHENFTHRLTENNPLLHFLQNIRDEVHRFAITTHRSKRSKMSTKSVFDELKGIGPERKKILKNHFGTIEQLKLATMEDLKQIKSIPENILIKIYEYFHSV